MTAPLTPQDQPPHDRAPDGHPPAPQYDLPQYDLPQYGLAQYGPADGSGQYDASGLPRTGTADGRASFRRELLQGALVAVGVAVLGVALGLLWLWLAPRITMVSDGEAVYLKNTEGEQAIGADGTFILIGLGLGVLCAAVVFWRYRRGGIGVVLGLAAGALLGSVIGWRLGTWFGPAQDIVAHAKAVGKNVVFEGPLELRAKGALLAWPIGATLVHLALTSVFGPRDEFAP